MALVSAKEMVEKAHEGHYAIPAFNINNLEWTKAVLAGVQEAKSPTILQVSEGAGKYMGGFKTVADMVRDLYESMGITVPVALHLDHGTYEGAKACIEVGFTSVMFDGSHYDFDENVAKSKDIISLAHSKGISVECEVGGIGGTEDGVTSNIMDGNGRWAKERGLERVQGHIQGVESVRKVVHAAASYGVEYLTIYAFSTENWGRPSREVEALMKLLCECTLDETPTLLAEGVRMRFLGDIDALSVEVRQAIRESEQATADNKGLTLQIAVNYSSRWELTRMARLVASEVAAGRFGAVENPFADVVRGDPLRFEPCVVDSQPREELLHVVLVVADRERRVAPLGGEISDEFRQHAAKIRFFRIFAYS